MKRFWFPVFTLSQRNCALKLNASTKSTLKQAQGYEHYRVDAISVNQRHFCASAQGKATPSSQNKEQEEGLMTSSNKETPSKIIETPEIEIEISPEVAARQEYYNQRRPILKMDEADYRETAFGTPRSQRLSLLEIREGTRGQSALRYLIPEKKNLTDQMAFLHADIDVRWSSIKRWLARQKEDKEILMQMHNPKRNSVLGNDLAAAHFIVYRTGKVKFLGQPVWVEHYRVDHEEGKTEDDLPTMQFDLCTLPTKYDPRYLVEAIDATNADLRYEGLRNLENLRYCKYLKLENNVHLDAWCVDRLACNFSERLEYLDLSGCTGLTEGALCALSRFRNLKTLVVKNLPQIRNKAVICAMLEDLNPNLEIIGVDYEEKLEELVEESAKLDKIAAEEEANTITIESKYDGPGPEQQATSQSQDTITQYSSYRNIHDVNHSFSNSRNVQQI